MAKAKPYVNAAFCCERVLYEKDGTLSAIRIVDTLTTTILDPAGAKVANVVVPITVLVALKAGDYVGESRVAIVVESPDGKRTQLPEVFNLVFTGGEQGGNLVVNLAISPENPGLYWIDVVCDDELLTRIPFRLRNSEPMSQPN